MNNDSDIPVICNKCGYNSKNDNVGLEKLIHDINCINWDSIVDKIVKEFFEEKGRDNEND